MRFNRIMKITLILMFAVVFLFTCSKKEMVEFGYVTFYYGDIEINQNGKKVLPKLKMVLNAGDSILTKAEARVDLQLQNFGLIRINQNSEMDIDKIITEVNESIKLKLNNGQILCKLRTLRKGKEFQVETLTAVAGVRGTTFLVETEKDKKTSEIAVLDGTVEVADKKSPEKKVTVKKNETAKVDTKSKVLKKVKGIDTKKLKEFKAIKNTKIFNNVKSVDIGELKKSSYKNLKNLNIKDMKGLGSEFKSMIPGKKGETKSAAGSKQADKVKGQADKKVTETKAQADKQKKALEQKKADAEKQKVEAEKKKKEMESKAAETKDKAKKAADDAKKKLKKIKF